MTYPNPPLIILILLILLHHGLDFNGRIMETPKMIIVFKYQLKLQVKTVSEICSDSERFQNRYRNYSEIVLNQYWKSNFLNQY